MSGARLLSLDAAAEHLTREGIPVTPQHLRIASVNGSGGVHMRHFRGDRRRVCFDALTVVQDYLAWMEQRAEAMRLPAPTKEQIDALLDAARNRKLTPDEERKRKRIMDALNDED